MRNLGTNRTLVLVNGRRHVAGEANTAAVDINSIPTDLIERVDVLTGAVSAIYGADGVTGVVNFILKKDFEGITGRVQYGKSNYGDAGNRFASLAAGRNFGDGLGNVTLAYEFNADDAVANDDRPFLRFDQRQYIIPNDAYTGADPRVPQNILVGGIRYVNESPIGAVWVGADANPSFDGLGRPYDSGTRLPLITKSAASALRSPASTKATYFPRPSEMLSTCSGTTTSRTPLSYRSSQSLSKTAPAA